jgi:hypothetical protein
VPHTPSSQDESTLTSASTTTSEDGSALLDLELESASLEFHSQCLWVTRQERPARPIRQLWEAPCSLSVRVLGYARSVASAAIDGVTGELFQAKLPAGVDRILDWVRAVPGPAAVTFEGGPTGFGLYRALTAARVRSVVAAPSML